MKTEELIEEIKGMTVMELAEVVKALEEEFSSKALTTSASSMTVIPLISSINSSVFMQLSPPFAQAIMRFELVLVVPVLVPILCPGHGWGQPSHWRSRRAARKFRLPPWPPVLRG